MISWKRIRQLNHYRRSALVGLLVSAVFMIYFFSCGFPPELRFAESPLIEVFSIVSFYAHMLSSPTYIAGTVDLFFNPTRETTIERWITFIAILLALVTAIYLVPSATFFGFISTTAAMVGSLAGISSRIGSIITSWLSDTTTRHRVEQAAIILLTCIGIALSLWIIISHAPIIHIAGVISFMTGAPTLSHGINSCLFMCIFTSTCMSGAEYLSKGGVFFLYLLGYSQDHVNKRYHEYQGTFFACVLSGLVVCFFMLKFSVLAGTAFAAPSIMLIVATKTVLIAKCFGIDGTWSRIGRTLSEVFEKDDTFWEKAAKVFWVVLGFAGVTVILDMPFHLKDYLSSLFSNRQPPPLPQSLVAESQGEFIPLRPTPKPTFHRSKPCPILENRSTSSAPGRDRNQSYHSSKKLVVQGPPTTSPPSSSSESDSSKERDKRSIAARRNIEKRKNRRTAQHDSVDKLSIERNPLMMSSTASS